LWEANEISTAYTPHPCENAGLYRCSGTDCGEGNDRYNGVCDKDGCDFNSYRQGNTTFFGPNQLVDTTKLFTVVTQFITSDGTNAGDLVEIRREYVQNGVVIPNSKTTWPGISPYNSVTDQYCTDQKTLFDDPQQFIPKGGLTAMGEALDRGMVLVLSLWDDNSAYMLWLDSNTPANGSVSTPGVARGTCAITSGVPSNVESQYGTATVKFSNFKWGPIGTTNPGNSPSSSGIATATGVVTTAGSGGSTTSRPSSGISSTTSPALTTTTSPPFIVSSDTTSTVTVSLFTVFALVAFAAL